MAEQRAGLLNNISTAKAQLEAVNSKIAGRLSVLTKLAEGECSMVEELEQRVAVLTEKSQRLEELISLPSARKYVN